MGWYFRIRNFLIGAAIGALLVALSKGQINGWFFFNLATAYMASIPLICLHECGHALIGRFVGLRVSWISIGYGRPLWEGSLFGLPFRVNLFPFVGATALSGQTAHRLRLRLWTAVAAGPATHGAVFGVCSLAFGGDLLLQRLRALNIASGPAPLEIFLCTNALIFLLNTFLLQVMGPIGWIRTDGHYLLKIPFWKEAQVREFLALYPALEAYEFMRTGNLAQAVQRYEAARALYPQSYVLRHDLAIAQLLRGDYNYARREFVQLLDSTEGRQRQRRLLLLNNIAWTDLLLCCEDLLPEAVAYSEEAIRVAPGAPSIQGTRGAVLVRTGHIQEGLSLLRKAFRRHSDRSARASVACWIAIAEARVGNTQAAAAWHQAARAICPWLNLLEWAQQEIQSGSPKA